MVQEEDKHHSRQTRGLCLDLLDLLSVSATTRLKIWATQVGVRIKTSKTDDDYNDVSTLTHTHPQTLHRGPTGGFHRPGSVIRGRRVFEGTSADGRRMEVIHHGNTQMSEVSTACGGWGRSASHKLP